MSRRIGVAWVPNISGNVTSESNLMRLVHGRTVRTESFVFSFHCDEDGVDVSIDGLLFAHIHPFNHRGLCEISDLTGSGMVLEVLKNSDIGKGQEFIARHRALWVEFRKMIDGCSEGCPCTAMDSPIPYTDGSNPFDLIAQKFVRSLESTADSGFYASALGDESPSSVAKRALMDETVNRSNVLYFQRYIDMYGDRTPNPDDYRSQISCRKDKSDLARHYYSEIHRIESEDRMESMIDISNNIAKGSNKVLDTIREFTESSNKLIESTNRMSQESDHKAKISMYVAIASMFLTFAALVVSIAVALS